MIPPRKALEGLDELAARRRDARRVPRRKRGAGRSDSERGRVSAAA
ncbi:MAG: hypothetical protein MZW92_09765 [Comamonadaceae bacterium]|nr:hypothetical protein [Comamonadaceae bacterium]